MSYGDMKKGVLLTASGAIGWGASGVCSQYLFSAYEVDAGWLTAVRMIFAGLLLTAAAAAGNREKAFGVFRSARDVLQLLVFAFLGLLLCQYTFMSAVRYSNSAAATVLQSLNVVIMAVVTAAYSRTRITARQAAAVLLAVLGTYLIATGGRPGRLVLSGMGLVMGILSAVGVVTYTLLSRRIIRKFGSMAVTGWGMLIGGAAAGAGARIWEIPPGLNWKAWIIVAFIVTIGTAVGFSVFLEGAKYIGASKATLIGCLEPASAAVLSMIFLKTTFGAAEAVGFFCILGTVFLSTIVSAPQDDAKKMPAAE